MQKKYNRSKKIKSKNYKKEKKMEEKVKKKKKKKGKIHRTAKAQCRSRGL